MYLSTAWNDFKLLLSSNTGARNNRKSHLGTTENYRHSLRALGLIIGNAGQLLHNPVAPQNNLKTRKLF